MRIKNRLAVILAYMLAVSTTVACGVDIGRDTKEETADTGSYDTKDTGSDSQETDGDKAGTEAADQNEAGSEQQETARKSEEEILEEHVQKYMDQMTVEEKAAQLFIIPPEDLMEGVSAVTAAGETTQKAISQLPVGGFVYQDKNLKSREQVKAMLENVQTFSMERSNLPMFLSVDEEGGTVVRISGTGKFDVPEIGDMSEVGERGDVEEAYETGRTIGAYLKDMGFNVDFAPVADVLSNPDNQVVKRRAFGTDPALVTSMAAAAGRGMEEQGICPVYKHFPGHGGTSADTHKGYAYVDKTLEELEEQDLAPFRKVIEDGAKMIMVGHISLPNVTGNDVPASMSPEIITGLLRTQMQYDGLVVTDALNMGAVTERYSSAEAAVQTILAGSDLVLLSANFKKAYQGVLDAVDNGTISQERLDESIKRILKIKLCMMQKNK